MQRNIVKISVGPTLALSGRICIWFRSRRNGNGLRHAASLFVISIVCQPVSPLRVNAEVPELSWAGLHPPLLVATGI